MVRIEFDRDKLSEREAQIVDAIARVDLERRLWIAELRALQREEPFTPEHERGAADETIELMTYALPDLNFRATILVQVGV